MSVVSDTGPLIALAKIDHLDVLAQLFGRVIVPPPVAAELQASRGAHQQRLQCAMHDWIETRPLTQPPPTALLAGQRLSAADREVIALAVELALPLIMDERAGRAAEQGVGVLVAGVAETIRRAKAAGLVPAVRPLLEAMTQEGYWLSSALIDQVARRAGE
jgi:predicted nucleic acid-binding protein